MARPKGFEPLTP